MKNWDRVRWTAANGQTLSPTLLTLSGLSCLVPSILLGNHLPEAEVSEGKEVIPESELVVASACASSHPPCGYGMDPVGLHRVGADLAYDLCILRCRGEDAQASARKLATAIG